MKKEQSHFFQLFLSLFLSLCLVSGCTPSYPSDYVEESIKEICFKEYGISDVEVIIKGKTLGVYLPLKQLFSVDYEKFLAGNMEGGESLEDLVRFHPEALEMVEDVLFSTSRVILSTDRDIEFYMLNATDTLVTGLQFSILGNILDMKRVRFWDIPRSEYRKRLIHDISINQSVAWKRNVKKFFQDLPEKPLEMLLDEFAVDPESFPESSPYFYNQLIEGSKKVGLEYEILDVRAKPLQGKEVLVYAKVLETFNVESSPQGAFQFPNEFVGEYLFVLSLVGLEFKIAQVIPFYFISDDGSVSEIQFPEELQIYQNLDDWPQDFDFEEVMMPDFLAEQVTKRSQGLFLEDIRIQQSFIGWKQDGKISFRFHPIFSEESKKEESGYFILNFFLRMRDKLVISPVDMKTNEELLYLMDLIFKEFGKVLHAYDYKDYSHVDIQFPVSNAVLMISQKDLIQFRKNKITIEELFNRSSTFD